MANKIINTTMLAYYDSEKKKVNATKAELKEVSDKVDEIIADGGEPNKIESITVNGDAVTIENKVAKLTNIGVMRANDTHVSVGGTGMYEASIGIGKDKTTGRIELDAYKTANHQVFLKMPIPKLDDIPTKTSELTNDSKYQTEDEVQTLIDNALTSALDYKGTVATASALPTTGNKKGDVYNIAEDGMNYAWDGTTWDALGGTIDLSSYWDKTNYTIATAIDIDAILNA